MEDKSRKGNSGIAAELYFWAQALVFVLIVLVCINVFFFRVSGVIGSSMNPTLSQSDYIIMKIAGQKEPQRGEIIVIMSEAFRDEPLVKRVIGVEGDVIDFDGVTGNLILNGEVMTEGYIAEQTRKFGDQPYPYTVPVGHVFVIGDNRNHSSDSRERMVGTLPCENIVGKVVLRLWPLNKISVPK